MSLLVSYSDVFLEHDPGPRHPERAERLRALTQNLHYEPPVELAWAEPEPASLEQALELHDREYVELLERLRGGSARLDPDTAVSPRSVEAAYLAAGAALAVVDAALAEKPRRGIALVRPPGHHAEADRAMGFCLLNSVAIAAVHALAQGLERILVVDWDVHHGNGTQHLFEGRRDVLFLSSHRGYGFYPGTGQLEEIGTGDGRGFTVNAPLPERMGDRVFVDLYRRLLPPIAEAYRPDLIIVSAGFDAHRRDPLGGMNVTDRGFGQICAIVLETAERFAGGRLALVLEGGYDLEGLIGGTRACLEILAGASPQPIEPATDAELRFVDPICEFHRQHWKGVT